MFPESSDLRNVLALVIRGDCRGNATQHRPSGAQRVIPHREAVTCVLRELDAWIRLSWHSVDRFETLNLDVLRLILLELRKTRVQGTLSLQALALCSHTLHDAVSPFLLHRYFIQPAHLPTERIRKFIK